MINSEFASGIYTGTVRHRRFSPKAHEFTYDVFMAYLDLSEIENVFSLSPFWSTTGWAPAQFKRSDFHLNQNQDSIDTAIRNTVEKSIGIRPNGPIRMLVNLRYWGFNINPLSTYYCFDESGETITAIVAEVHNTPWNERHAYVLDNTKNEQEKNLKKQRNSFNKTFHVSPFNPLDMHYEWQSTTPNKTIAIHLENWQGNLKIMDATMTLQRKKISTKNMNMILIQFPLMTVKVVSAIYWQALKLWLKGVPLFNHPKKNEQ